MANPSLDTLRREFEAEVGSLIGAWANVEHMLVDLMAAALSSRNDRYVHAAFYSLSSLDARIGMVDAVIRMLLHDPKASMTIRHRALFKVSWMNMTSRANRLKKTRNAVAHGQIVKIVNRNGKGETDYRLTPAIYDPRLNLRSKQKPGLSVNDVAVSCGAVHRLFEDLMEFNSIFAEWAKGEPFEERLRALATRLRSG